MLQFSPTLYSSEFRNGQNVASLDQTRCWTEIDGSALRTNALFAQKTVGPNANILAVVKSDGYGHGMINVATELMSVGIIHFGVVNLLEASHLQDELANSQVKICLLAPALPSEREEIVARKIRPWLSSVEEALDYQSIAKELNLTAPFDVEIEVDTGMGRGGVIPREFPKLLEIVRQSPQLRLVGMVTHLSSPESNTHFTKEQLSAFEFLTTEFFGEEESSGSPGSLKQKLTLDFLHAQNSAGLLGYPVTKGGTLVRPGLMLYGSSPIPSFQKNLEPALTLKARVILTKELPAGHGVSYGRTFVTDQITKVATISIGYADGYPWSLSGQGAQVLIRGVRCPVLGRITMDQVIISIDPIKDFEVIPGEEVVLIGKQNGEEISVNEVATKAGTIPYEIFTGLKPRNGRFWLR